ncbi:MAG: hypothetical protein NT154_39635 [Verrucomicrobia bacterium]|nr:hypothetical protein [Verrucomicrobiota bacterium]
MIAVLAGLNTVLFSASAQPHYLAVDVSPGGTNNFYSGYINNAGHLVCNYGDGAVFFNDGNTTDIGSLGGGVTIAYDINNLDQIVGQSQTASGDTHGFLYVNGKMADLGGYQAYGINDSGQIIMRAVVGGKWRSLLLTNGSWLDIGTPLGYDTSCPFAINNAGQVAGVFGVSGAPAGMTHGFLYSGGTNVDLGSIGTFDLTTPHSINNAGEVVGECRYSGGSSDGHAFLYAGGVMTDLGTFGSAWSQAECINNAGQIVGNYVPGGWYGAFYYTGGTNGTMYDLDSTLVNRYVGGVDCAYSINDSGQIAAFSRNRHAFLLNPVQIQPLTILTGDGNCGFQTNHFGFNITGTVGILVAVQRSVDLTNWNTASTLTNRTGTTFFLDPSPSQQRLFYRLQQQ